MTVTEDLNRTAFKVISSFINSLADVFGEDDMGVLLYAHLLSKTTDKHVVAIEKNINIFRDFCIANRSGIADKSLDGFTVDVIEYSEKVKFNIKDIFKLADAQTTRVLWIHLLTISAVVDPTGNAKSILKSRHATKEGEFISGFLDKVEKNVDPNSNPIDAITRLMSSGLLGNLITEIGGGMKEGTLDMDKLMGSAQDIVSNLTGKEVDFKKIIEGSIEDGSPPDIAKVMSDVLGDDFGDAAKKMMGGGADGAPPDLSKMMSSLMGGGADGAPPDLAKMMGALDMKPQPKKD